MSRSPKISKNKQAIVRGPKDKQAVDGGPKDKQAIDGGPKDKQAIDRGPKSKFDRKKEPDSRSYASIFQLAYWPFSQFCNGPIRKIENSSKYAPAGFHFRIRRAGVGSSRELSIGASVTGSVF